jgi:hypothetical protein
MRGVSGVSKSGAAAGTRGAARPAGGFSLGGAGVGAAAAGGPAAASATAAVGLSLLAVQENGGRAGRDAAARRRAASLLDELQGLQAELLGGRPDPGRLGRLAALQTGEDGAEPELREAVRAVALRARIELARRGLGTDPHRSTTVS